MEKTSLHRKISLYPFLIIPIFVWIGFVCSISFMEAWLKFRAPNTSLSTGLSIGRVIFAALNKVEWVLAGITTLIAFLDNHKPKLAIFTFLWIPILILVLQTSWLLPSLNQRAENIIQNKEISSSFVHFYYLFLEFIKVFSLFMLGTYALCRLANRQPRND